MVDFEKAIDNSFMKMPGAIADFFIRKASQDSEIGESITPLKLQKLLYYSYAWWLALKDQRIFTEPVEAWKHGPVVPSQWTRFKKYERKHIKVEEIETLPGFMPQPVEEYLGAIWRSYGQYTA